MINRKKFYNSIRKSLFGKITTSQVHGMEAKINEWERIGLPDLRWFAYMLGTSYHETDKKMVPIEEYGKGKGRKYGKPVGPYNQIYYGRGDVQLTWYENYNTMGGLLGLPLTAQPHLALIPEISMKIMFEGMTTGVSLRGDFTGHHLGMYFNEYIEDWVNARRIINRMDKAKMIAEISKKFHRALT